MGVGGCMKPPPMGVTPHPLPPPTSDCVTINCSGFRYETYKITLKKFQATRLSRLSKDSANYDPVRNEYFFDRHPGVFSQVLNYYRTGELHYPKDVCGSLFEKELDFWGIDANEVENCCWITYMEHKETLKTLRELDELELNAKEIECNDVLQNTPKSRWKKNKARIWSIFNEPSSSPGAKIVRWISIACISISIGSFLLKTTTDLPLHKISSDRSLVDLSRENDKYLQDLPRIHNTGLEDRPMENGKAPEDLLKMDGREEEDKQELLQFDDKGEKNLHRAPGDDKVNGNILKVPKSRATVSTEAPSHHQRPTVLNTLMISGGKTPWWGRNRLREEENVRVEKDKRGCNAAMENRKKWINALKMNNITFHDLLSYIDILCITWFTLELFLKFISYPTTTIFFKRLVNIFDMVATFSFYIQHLHINLILPCTNLEPFTILLNLLVLLRLARLAGYFTGLKVLMQTLLASLNELLLMLFFFILSIIVFASLVYFAEKDSENLSDSTNISSIPKALWWALVTMTAVGYGDVVPKTNLGMLIGSVCALCGVLAVSLPVSVIVSNFVMYYTHSQARVKCANMPNIKRMPSFTEKRKSRAPSDDSFKINMDNILTRFTSDSYRRDSGSSGYSSTTTTSRTGTCCSIRTELSELTEMTEQPSSPRGLVFGQTWPPAHHPWS